MTKKTLFLSLMPLLWLGMLSCNDEAALNEEIAVTDPTQDIEVLSFSSKNSFQDCLQSLTEANYSDQQDVSTRSAGVTPLSSGQSLFGSDIYDEVMREYIPNENLAKFLNKNGEIMVADTIYRITPNGTYFYPKEKKALFNRMYAVDSTICGALVGDKLYKVAEGIYRYDTYWYKREEHRAEVESGFITENSDVTLRNYGAEPDYNSFPTFNSVKKTTLHFVAENIIGPFKAQSVYYEHTNKRRVRGEFYENNYAFSASVGTKAWTDKKNWFGWSKTEADELRIGWKDVVLVTKIPDYLKEDMKKINQPMESKPGYHKYPAPTPKHLYGKVYALPNLNESEFMKFVNLGSKRMYDLLKKRYGVSTSQSEWEKIQAFSVMSRTHIFHVIKDGNIKKTNCEYYNHTFMKHAKVGITLNLNSFSGNWTDVLISAAVNIFNTSSKQAHVTLYGGRVYIAAKFGNEWQGMTIKKDAK